MSKQLKIGNKTFSVGDECIVTKYGSDYGLGPEGNTLEIHSFKEVELEEPLIGVISKYKLEGWGSLDLQVETGYGLWLSASNFVSNLRLVSVKYKFCNGFLYKGVCMDSMMCKVLHKFENNNVFVEADTNINGGSCDGLGKTGHCIIVPIENLNRIKR